MPGTHYSLEIRPLVPQELARLHELANDLLYSWDNQVRGLFHRLDPELWESCVHNPKVFLRRVAQSKLEAAIEDSDIAILVLDAEEGLLEGDKRTASFIQQ